MPVVIAQQEDTQRYLIDLERDDHRGYVYDDKDNVAFQPLLDVETILARGYWIGILNNPDIVARAEAAPKVGETAATRQPVIVDGEPVEE